MTKVTFSDSLVNLLKKLAAGEKIPGFRSLVYKHKYWCPRWRDKGPCICGSKPREVTKEEFDRLVLEKKQQDEELKEWG